MALECGIGFRSIWDIKSDHVTQVGKVAPRKGFAGEYERTWADIVKCRILESPKADRGAMLKHRDSPIGGINLISLGQHMSNSITFNAQNGNSPFDSIRGYRADGSEFWTGRELMRFLGFSNWEKFSRIILDAIEDIEILDQGTAIHHIRQTEKMVKRIQGGGRTIIDYDLSRLGCYHVALACKQRTSEVAAARRYFAVKTREAEIVIPAQTDRLRELELELMLIKAKTDCNQSEQKLLDTRHIIVSTCPEPVQQKILGYQIVEKIEYRDRVIQNEDIIRDGNTTNKTNLCHRYGLLKAGKPQYKLLNQLLEKLPSEAFRLTASIVENNELDLAFLPQLDRIFQTETRQLNFGEN